MKINMPVTNQEILVKQGQILVSRTDLKGSITYMNDEFISISGYSREELMGSNHNIIRHPDMPTAVFEYFWKSIQALRPWQGLVKNKTKSGDFYWVNASVLPIFKNGKLHEYLSVRRSPSREDIEQAEQLYRQLNTNKVSLETTGSAALLKSIKEMEPLKKIAIAQAMQLTPIFYLMYQLFLAQDYPLLAGVTVSAIIASLISFNTLKNFDELLNKTIRTFYSLAEKKFSNKQDLTQNGLIGDFYRALFSMEINLNLDLAQAKEEAVKSMQLNHALDKVHAGVMVANNRLEIIYTNDSVQQMFKNAENDIRTQLPNFSADKLLGASIDSFHKVPAHQRRLLENLKETYHGELHIANQYMKVTASPVINAEGERIGFVAEWQDRTHEVLIEQEIEQLVQDIKAGDLSTRIDIVDKQGFAKMLSCGINELTDVIESVFNDVNRVMDNMAEGDLTRPITNNYQGVYAECKRNINGTLEKLSDFISQIRDAADFIASSSHEMAAGNNNLSSRAEQQVASLKQTAANMEDLASTVKNNMQKTTQATEAVNSTTHVAKKGGEIVKSAISAMQDINISSNNIAEIIGVIDEIAFQTNLLALNAAVEAARAGEHGRGFAVVATEVRNLAQRSAVAAKQSNELIQNSVEKVRAGTAYVNETGAALIEIIESINKVGALVTHIASVSSEQSMGIDLVNQAVTQMDEITQQNAALAEQAAAGSIAMSEQSHNMNQLVNLFKVDNSEVFEVVSKPSAVAKAAEHEVLIWE